MTALGNVHPENKTTGYEEQFKVSMKTDKHLVLFIFHFWLAGVAITLFIISVAGDPQTKWFGVKLQRCQTTAKSVQEQGF